MRIFIDGRCINPHYPGIGRYTRNLVRALPLISCDDVILLSNGPFLEEMGPSIRQRWVGAAVRSLAEQWTIPRAVRTPAPALYHAPYFVHPYLTPVPSVVTIHDVIPVRPRTFLPSRRARIAYEIAVRLALASSRRVVTPSSSTRRDLIARYRVSPDRVAVTPYGVDRHFAPCPESEIRRVRERYGLSQEYVLYVGVNKPHKNLERLIEAFTPLVDQRPEQLVLAGPENPRSPDLRGIAQRNGLGDRVAVLGRVDEEDLAGLYAGATLFVFPSLHEGFGLPAIEAMACGTPVACSNIASLLEVTAGAALCFDPTDVGAMTAALIQALEDRALREHLRQRGLARAAQLTWLDTARATLEVYREVVA